MNTDCRCEIPVGFPQQEKADICVKCSKRINSAWTSNDRTIGAFYDRLATILREDPEVLSPDVNPAWQQFRIEAEARERAGRRRFGHRALGRDNCRDGWEEASDGGNYAFFESLKDIRADRADENIDLLLLAAKRFFEGYEALANYRRRRDGSP